MPPGLVSGGMVDAFGHVAMALLWSAPAWVRWDGRVSLAFVGYAVLTAMVPDVDLLVPWLAHNGPTHSVTFVALVAIVAGGAFAVAAEPVLTRWWFEDEHCLPERSTIYAFTVAALFVGGTSHVVTDLLSTGALERGLVPLWPFFDTSIAIDVAAVFTDPAWSAVLLVLALTVHVGLFVVDRR